LLLLNLENSKKLHNQHNQARTRRKTWTKPKKARI